MDPDDESLSALLVLGQRLLLSASIEDARRESRRLLAHALGVSLDGLPSRHRIGADARLRFEGLLRRRAAHEPFAYITGSQGFWTLDLDVSAHTLIPRGDSETVIESLLRLRPDRSRAWRVLDLGTGTGCLLLAALHEYRQATGLGVDLSPAACRVAARNARRTGLAERAMLVCGRWHDALAGPRFDIILSNPPYIPTGEIPLLMPEVARHEPHLALDGGPDGLEAYRSILRDLGRRLAPGGIVLLEIGQGQAAAVTALGSAAGFRLLEVRQDLGGVARALALAQA
ncbi:peptide chain release factor N(5)-glutamine methyltransferase [Lichenicoccus sp.]|uniref:peptide chain release factor N(5)-glutamine methyltransferase n=1 Tax=Lichenicoccus sp. TaxID=2781899 RepID=UPI003D0FE9DA